MPKEIQGEKYYTTQEVGEMLGVCVATVRSYVTLGRLTGQRIGRGIYIPERSLRDFLKCGK